MAKNRIVNTRFWVDDYISNLDPVEKLLFLYFLTSPATDISGVYEIPLKTIATDTGIDHQTVARIIKRFGRDKKIFYVSGWVGVVNFAKHQLDNPSVRLGIKSGLSKAPQFILDRLGTVCGQSAPSLLHTNTDTDTDTDTNTESKRSAPPLKTVDELWDEMIAPYRNKFAPSMFVDFENHWRAKNPGDKKERWQMEKIFDMGRRLDTWKRREEKFDRIATQRQQLKQVDERPTHREPVAERVDSGPRSIFEKISF